MRRINPEWLIAGAAVVVASWILIAIQILRSDASTAAVCPSRTLLHLNCPFCGLTRCTNAFLHADWQAAWLYSPGGFIALSALVLLTLLLPLGYLLHRLRPAASAPLKFPVGIVWALVIALLLHSVYQMFFNPAL